MADTSDLDDRKARAAKIIRSPEQYKICVGCDSIVAHKVVLCPNCHSYRYDTRASEVVAQAKTLSQRRGQSVLLEDLED
ncbi:MAG: hypothetical protein AAF555_06450 [Verrucomicrobiota bacterium]